MSKWITIPFVQLDDRFCARLSNEHLAAEFIVLEVQTSADAAGVAAFIEDFTRFWLGPESQYGRFMRGLKLEFLRQPASELPASPGSFYFQVELRDNSRLWEVISRELRLSISFRTHTYKYLDQPHFKLHLHFLLP